MCLERVSRAIDGIVKMLIKEGVECFDAMSVLKRLPEEERRLTHHKEVNIEVITMYHDSKMPWYVICMPRPVPGHVCTYHRVYVNTLIRMKIFDGVRAEERDSRIKTEISTRKEHLDISPSEYCRRVMEAILFGGYNPV